MVRRLTKVGKDTHAIHKERRHEMWCKRIDEEYEVCQKTGDWRINYPAFFHSAEDVYDTLTWLKERDRDYEKHYGLFGFWKPSKRHDRLVRMYWAFKKGYKPGGVVGVQQ